MATLEETAAAALLSDASKPASIAGDGMSQSNRDLHSLIELDKYASRKAAHKFGFSMRQMIPPEH
ncbi:MAG TPA: hypothetical protein VMX97_09365 [Hyphomicrobiaceae bacterium]|nr:hypothetical protein [Hyphomicrobiaceae bacterium]